MILTPITPRASAIIGIALATPFAHAGSGTYLGADLVHQTLDTRTTTRYSAILPVGFGESQEDFQNWGLRLGHKFKGRLTDRYFWAPELALAPLDDNDLIYSTNLRFGYETAPWEFFSSVGVTRIEPFTDNRLNVGVGLEYRLSNQASLSLEWTGYDRIDEVSEATLTIGLTDVDVRTETERDLHAFRIGFTYYFQGSR
jgi:hypothetical protein